MNFSDDSFDWLAAWCASAKDDLIGRPSLPVVGTILCPDSAMYVACVAALQGTGRVSPNPLVGAVFVDRDFKLVSYGAHLQVGGPHAEIEALQRLPPDAKDLKCFVTLEPCSHFGRTPPCADQLMARGVKEVYFGAFDPNPLVNGQGRQRLQDAGVKVQHVNSWNAACIDLADTFHLNQKKSRPYFAVKIASSHDDVIAGHQTSRQWITGERAREYGRYLRLHYDAILIGDGTALLDNPTLDMRHSKLTGRNPAKVILDPFGHTFKTPHLKIYGKDLERTFVLSQIQPPKDHPAYAAHVIQLETDELGLFSWEAIGQTLWSRGIRSILVEGGQHVYHSILQCALVDKIYHFESPNKLRDPQSRLWYKDIPMKQAVDLNFEMTGKINLAADTLTIRVAKTEHV